MSNTDNLIDLTSDADNNPRHQAQVSQPVAIDLTGPPAFRSQVVDLPRPALADEAGQSNSGRTAALQNASASAAAPAAEPVRRSVKRKRLNPEERAQQKKERLEHIARKTEAKAAAKAQRQIEVQQELLEAKAKKEEAKRQKAEDRANRIANGLPPPTKIKRLDHEGNTVRFCSCAPRKVKDRMKRAMPDSGHRLFLLDRHEVSPMSGSDGPVEEFSVLGATANVYTVIVGKHPACTCPDFEKGNICKHYLFIMLRVLRLDQTDPLVWQRALLKSEAEQVLGGTRSTRADAEVLADQSVISHYRRLAGRDTGSTSSSAAGPGGTGSKQRPIEGECAVCYDTLKAGGSRPEDRITFCKDCGNNVHIECLKKWIASKKETGEAATCVYCRCAWPEPDVCEHKKIPCAGAAKAPQEYVNLRNVSDQHQQADTTLETLYGDTAVWIRASHGHMGRRQAANLWRLSQAT